MTACFQALDEFVRETIWRNFSTSKSRHLALRPDPYDCDTVLDAAPTHQTTDHGFAASAPSAMACILGDTVAERLTNQKQFVTNCS